MYVYLMSTPDVCHRGTTPNVPRHIQSCVSINGLRHQVYNKCVDTHDNNIHRLYQCIFYMSTIKLLLHIRLYIIYLSTALVYARWMLFLFVYMDNDYCLYYLYWPHHVNKSVAMATLWQASNKTNECFIVCGRLSTMVKEPRDIPHHKYRYNWFICVLRCLHTKPHMFISPWIFYVHIHGSNQLYVHGIF